MINGGIMLNMDLSHLIKLMSAMPATQEKSDEPAQEEKPQTAQEPASANPANPLTSMLPLLMKSTGQESMLPLLSMMQGGGLNHEQLFKHLMSQPKTEKKTGSLPASNYKSELDGYTRLE